VSAPAGLVEALELERHAARELARRADELWRAGRHGAAYLERCLADEARRHVGELELELEAVSS
jgi:hypothetical protein